MLRNGNINGNDFRHGRSVSFTCDRGYEFKGDATITCNDGAWSGNQRQCQGKSHHTVPQ